MWSIRFRSGCIDRLISTHQRRCRGKRYHWLSYNQIWRHKWKYYHRTTYQPGRHSLPAIGLQVFAPRHRYLGLSLLRLLLSGDIISRKYNSLQHCRDRNRQRSRTMWVTHNCSVGSVRVARTSGAFERLTTDLVAPNSVHDIPRRGPNNMKLGLPSERFICCGVYQNHLLDQ